MDERNRIVKLAAVDVGSNAARLLLANVFEGENSWTPRKASLLRMPVRLGDDAFLSGRISEGKARRLVNTMVGFKHLIEAFEAEETMACATSAMREAKNGEEIGDAVFEASGIRLEIIDGKREAEIILENRGQNVTERNRHVLFVDVGGGSTEITSLSEGRIVSSHSFNIGSIRSANRLVPEGEWKRMEQWLKQIASGREGMTSIGSGGNIKAIFGLSNTKFGKPISRRKIAEVREYLQSFTVDQLVSEVGLKPDRADVIVPASEIYLNAMRWSGIAEMHVPMLGLADGMVRVMYKSRKNGKKEIEKEKAVGDPSLSR